MHKRDSIGMKLCSLLICLCMVATVKATEEQAKRTITVSNVITGTAPQPSCGPLSYVWPITFNEAGDGAVVFTLESVPTTAVQTPQRILNYYYFGFYPIYRTIYTTTLVPTKTLKDVTIGISTRPTTQGDPSAVNPMIEIVLGLGGTRSVIRRSRGGPEIAALDHDSDRVKPGSTYWVSLVTNRVRVGTGTQINTNTFMDVNLVTATVVNQGETFPGRYVGFGCQSTPITFTQVSLVADCVLSDFDSGSACSSQCGGGKSTRRRTVIADVSGAEYGAAVCQTLSQDSDCNTQPCPIACTLNQWTAWSTCDQTCGGGSQRRSRTTKSPAQFGGAACDSTDDLRDCNTNPCPIDCKPTDWGDWSACSQPCGGAGVHQRFRSVSVPAQFGGKDCPTDSMSQITSCNTQPCPIDCQQNDWSDWTDCSKPCNTGTQDRARQTITQPNYGGVVCGPDLQSQDCNKQDCPKDCILGDWTAWGPCDSPCGTGSFTRTRVITQAPTLDGKKCDTLIDEGACNTQECPVDRLSELVKRIRHLELQDRVSSLEEQAITDAQNSVAKTVGTLAATAATAATNGVSAISLKETVTHGHAHAHALTQTAQTQSQQLSHLHPQLVLAANPFLRPSITQLLSSEILVDELAKWAQKQDEIEKRATARSK